MGELVSANVCANLLGLGNAATPMGIAATQRMSRYAKPGEASHEMCRLIVMNTASIQLIPTNEAAVRAGLGSAAPFDILPAVLGDVTMLRHSGAFGSLSVSTGE